jgi:hypothetical protein
MHGYVKPSLLATTTGAMNTMLVDKYAFIMGFLDLLPYMLFATAVIYLLVLIFKKERTETYG